MVSTVFKRKVQSCNCFYIGLIAFTFWMKFVSLLNLKFLNKLWKNIGFQILQPLKSQKTTVYPPECHVGAAESDRSEGPHNIFRPDVAMSSSEDDDLDNIEETLSQSINKLQNLQSQLSGINKNNFADDEPVSGASSHRSSRTTVKDSSREVTPRNVPTSESREFRSNSLANNMTSQGQNQRAKASLSSFEKSYQNIKHKTPVNQVKKTPVLSASATQVCMYTHKT